MRIYDTRPHTPESELAPEQRFPEDFRDKDLALTGWPVGFYNREFYCFDNFSAFTVRWPGFMYDQRDEIVYPTVEHGYQSQKFVDLDHELADRIAAAPSAHEALMLARANPDKIAPDWHEIKVDVMEELLICKLLQHEYVRRKLLQTGERRIVEDSPTDSFWGWGPHHNGENNLGKLWMKLRDRLVNHEFDLPDLAKPDPDQPAEGRS
jgi:ribA/ribD-fused uncharacterized protein